MVFQTELESSISLHKFMIDEGLVASPEEELRLKNVIHKIEEILIIWIRRVAYQRRLPKNQIKDASATILTYGSYGLGVHDVESNIDVLCVGPCFASKVEDFFIVLHNMLAGRPEVSHIHCVKDTEIPLLQFIFEGILIDMPFAKLKVAAVPENADISNPLFVNYIDETSWKSLRGVQAKTSILQLVPVVKIFKELVCCVRSWAKRRGVYSDLFGFFGSIHLAVLAAFICQKNPSSSLVDLISIFFKTFAFWPWPEPVVLHEGAMLPPLPHGKRALMPIQLPSSPNEYCHLNMTTSTFNKIRSEFRRGCRLTQDPFRPQHDWRNLFEPFPYLTSYARFIKICLSTCNKDELVTWVLWVKSHMCSLLVKLEELQALCDPNPTEYIDMSIQAPNVVLYWGLVSGRGDYLDVNSARENFLKNLVLGYQGNPGHMTLAVVQASQLLKTLQPVDSRMKAQLKLSNTNPQRQMVPVYSIHSPRYIIGHLATDGDGDPEHRHDQVAGSKN